MSSRLGQLSKVESYMMEAVERYRASMPVGDPPPVAYGKFLKDAHDMLSKSLGKLPEVDDGADLHETLIRLEEAAARVRKEIAAQGMEQGGSYDGTA